MPGRPLPWPLAGERAEPADDPFPPIDQRPRQAPGSLLAPLRAKAMERFARYRTSTLDRPPAIMVVDGRRNDTSASALRAGLGASKSLMLE